MLNVAQPALGVQIRNLERELGAQLFRRHARGVVPTEAGERLAQHAHRLLQHFELVRQDLIGFAKAPHARVVLYIGRTIPSDVVAAIAETCCEHFPDLQLVVAEGRIKQLAEPGNEGERPDIMLTFRPDKDLHLTDGYAFPHQLWGGGAVVHDELYLIYSPNTGLLADEIALRTALDRPLVLPNATHAIRQMIDQAADTAGYELDTYCDMDSISRTRSIVARGDAATFLPVACVREDLKSGRLRAARVDDYPLGRTLRILSRTDQRRSSAVDLVRRQVQELLLEFADDASLGWSRTPLMADDWEPGRVAPGSSTLPPLMTNPARAR